MKYLEIKAQQPEMFECFFAFSDEQLAKGKAEKIPEGKKIFSGGMGLYGTREGIDKLLAFYDSISEQIGKECDPQEVYNYEFNNYECGYLHDDTEAIKLVVSYFGEERAAKVKRRNGCAHVGINNLDFRI